MRLTTWLAILESLRDKFYYDRIPAINDNIRELCRDILDIFVYHIRDEVKHQEEEEKNGKMS